MDGEPSDDGRDPKKDPSTAKIVVFPIYEKKWKNIYANHVRGIAKGNPILLTYDSDKVRARNRRTAAMKASGLAPSAGMHRDEYPYAHTEEGGANASVMYVPKKENESHGGAFSALVRKNNLKTGDKILIVLIPNTKEPAKERIPIIDPAPPVVLPYPITQPIVVPKAPSPYIPRVSPVPPAATPALPFLFRFFIKFPIIIINPDMWNADPEKNKYAFEYINKTDYEYNIIEA